MHSATVALSVSLFWPAPDCRSEVLPKRRRRKRRPKATSSLVPVTSTASVKVGCNPPKPLSVATPTLNSADHHPALSSSLRSNNTKGDSSRSEKTDSDASVKESKEKDESEEADSDDEKGDTWTSHLQKEDSASTFLLEATFSCTTESWAAVSSSGEENDCNSIPIPARTRSKLKS